MVVSFKLIMIMQNIEELKKEVHELLKDKQFPNIKDLSKEELDEWEYDDEL